jgi:hypothetical protein
MLHSDGCQPSGPKLRSSGVEILKGPDTDDNGKFAWIVDPDGNKVEL